MSQFGGGAGKPGAWGRPGSGAQIPGFGGIGGVGSFSMMGVGMPMINQNAFSQSGMMGMGVMGAVPQQQQRSSAVPSASLGGQVNAKTRTFVGVVTKMHDSYGFVDDDVFFQHSVIRGGHPRVGDKVMVEASYNPQMPFKWNAYRIQLLTSPNEQHQPLSSQARVSSPVGSRGMPMNGQSSRWGNQDRNGSRGSPTRRRSPSRRSPARRVSPSRSGGSQRRKSRSPARRSPPPVRRSSPPRDRKRPSVAPSSRKDSMTPPRRRARIIPRYECRSMKPVLQSEQLSVVQVRSRYSKMYIPSDFVDLTPDWIKKIPLDTSPDYTNSVSYHVLHKDVDFECDETECVLESEDADHRHQVKVLLMGHSGKMETLKKALGLMPDGSIDEAHEVTNLFRHLQFLVGTRGKEFMGLGGSYSPSLDGPDPTNPATMIKTAIRTTKAMTGIDLSSVPQWYSLVQVRYYRADKDRVDRVHLLWPDTQLLMPSEEQWSSITGTLRAQYERKLAAIEELSLKDDKKPAVVATKEPTPPPTPAPVKAEEEKPVDISPPSKTDAEEAAKEADEKPKLKASHWNDLDVKTMKVAELKAELEARGLETRGIKTLLATRLQEALDKEQELEEDGPPESESVPAAEPEPAAEEKKEETLEEEKKDDEVMIIEEEVPAKTEEELKKEADELQKKIEKFEKEKKEKKAVLEKHFTLPKEPKVLVFPSKTAKSGKFDCKFVTLQQLLDYRLDDNKESQFEVSLYAEAFRELVERQAAFKLYTALSTSADRETEKKRRDEAKGVAPEPEKTEETEKKEGSAEKKEGSEEKPEKTEKPEKIELRNVVADRALFEACAVFDMNLCGYIAERDLEEVLMNSDFGITRGIVTKLCHKWCYRDRFCYRELTDNLVDPEGNVKYVPSTIENAPEVDTLMKGYGYNSVKEESESTSVSTSSDGLTVIINGSAINVPQKLALLKKSEQERDKAVSALNEQNYLLAQLRDQKQDLEKKKKDLEKELDKSKKKLSDTGSALKTSLEDGAHLRTALADCRRYFERGISVVDKACPPPKKEEKEKKVEEKVKEVPKEKTERNEEEEIPADALVLSDETGPEAESQSGEAVEKMDVSIDESSTTAKAVTNGEEVKA